MNLSIQGQFRSAIQIAFAAGVVGTGINGGVAFAQETSTTQLQGVEVTGSRIRRVDVETANPVFVIDRKAIEASGSVTLGKLLQRIPAIAGAATNPAVNNGGGNGASTVELRGLGSQRTLILLDGVRFNAGDVNSLPTSLIERVEILKDGASTVYGSDAIAGVVNFITRKNFTGIEAEAYYGETDQGDGATKSASITLGSTLGGGKGNVAFGINYNDQDLISSSRRSFSNFTYVLYGGQNVPLGSSTNPAGRFFLPTGSAARTAFNCPSVVQDPNANTPGFPGYRCYVGGGSPNDTYNFQAANVVLTPTERLSLFGSGNYRLFENVSAFSNFYYTNTKANSQIAPDPFNAATYGIPVTADAFGNPFGTDLVNYTVRLVPLGNRRTFAYRDELQVTNGLKGVVFDRFEWNVSSTYSRSTENDSTVGSLYLPAVSQALNCVPGNAGFVDGCTPVNFFQPLNLSADQLTALSPVLKDNFEQSQYIVSANVNGELFKLPAGPVSAAIGYEYRYDKLASDPDYLKTIGQTDVGVSQALSGAFFVNEVYGEAVIPIISKLPFVKSLTAIVGVRISDYSTFGGTTNAKYGIEYRPYSDLLIRATYADIFRSPTISDLFQGASGNFPTVNDPCSPGGNPNPACAGAPAGYVQSDSQFATTTIGNPNLKPETGYTTNFGFVYNPSWYTPLSFEVDYWHYSIKGAIGAPGEQNIVDLCFRSGDPNSAFCQLISRAPLDGSGGQPGEINDILNAPVNAGRLETRGVDFGIKWNIGKTPFGRVLFTLDNTYIQRFRNQTLADDPTTIQERAGTFLDAASGGDGIYPRLRSIANIFWTYGDWSVTVSDRFIGDVRENPAGTDADFNAVTDRHIGYANYVDLSASYNIRPAHTEVTVGVNNVGGDEAQFVYSGFNGNTDARTYDTVGRFIYGRLKWSFK